MNAENRCFAELAPLYVLDALDEIDRRWVEDQIAANPELAAELAEHETTVAALSYSAPPLPIADSLKDRLFDRLGFDRSSFELSNSTPSPSSLPNSLSAETGSAVETDSAVETELNWQPHSIPGVSIAVLHIDEEKREISCLLKTEPGARYPLHRHAGIEEVLVLEGSLEIDGQHYGKYSYIRSEQHSTHALTSPQGCICFVRTSLDNEGLED